MTSAATGAQAAKPRPLQDGRDMFWSIAPLVAACIVLAGVLGMCSFHPADLAGDRRPPTTPPPPLQADADALKIPIRLPRLPEGWRSNSGSRAGIDGGRTDPSGQPARAVASRIGYLAPSGMYMALTQSNADEDKLVGSIDPDLYPTGAQDVDGVGGWSTKAVSGEPVWTTRLDGPTGPGADRGEGCRRYGRVPYAGGGDADSAATARDPRQDGDPMTAPEADLTGWTAAPFSAAGYTRRATARAMARVVADPGDARHASGRAGTR